jgi:hypothetical protein
MPIRRSAAHRFRRYHELIFSRSGAVEPMKLATFFVLTIFLFLAIVGGIAGIMLEGRRIPSGSGAHNPATHDTVFPIVGWACLFALYLALEYVGAQNLTPEFRVQLGTLAVLPLIYSVLVTAWLIWRSARRIGAWLRGSEPVAWRTIPYLGRLRFPILLLAAILATAAQFWFAGFSLGFFFLVGIAVIFALIQR